MLILQRRKGEAVQIGDTITVTVTEIGTDRVRLAIDAPREMSIKRTELLEAARMNQEAANGASPAILRKLLQSPQKQGVIHDAN